MNTYFIVFILFFDYFEYILYLCSDNEKILLVMGTDDRDNKVVIFARVSSLSSERQNTDRQVADLSVYAAANGFEVLEIFTERITGAKKNKERPVLNECIEFCFRKQVDLLLVSELSRIGRNSWEILENIKRCKDNGLNVFFQKEGLSIFQSDGKDSIYLPIMIAVLGTAAELERENIYYRLQSGRTQYISNGGKVGRSPGSCKTREQKEQEYKGVIRRLKNGEKIRDIAKLEDVGVSTVQRIKKEFINHYVKREQNYPYEG